MTSQRQRPLGDLSEVPYFSLDLHLRPEQDVVELLLSGDLDEATVGHLEAAGPRVAATDGEG
jgi:hypothetical protein